ncbi:response regulator [Flavobacterium sp.]|uniref:response regulator n=1 Tax=Flavobacterium sp. TaxID=239 RepID=UPI00286B4211|nr:response regulator [Flavobacterium sp.]
MIKIRYNFTLLFSLIIFSGNCLAQTKTPTKKDISKLAKQATQYMRDSNFEKSLILSRQVLREATITNDNSLIAGSYNTIGANYNYLGEFDKAISFYKKGIFYADKTDNDTIKFRLNNNLGNLYCFEKKQNKIGISYFKKSIDYSLKIGDISQILFTKINVAWVYFDIGQFDKGFPYLEFITKNNLKYGEPSNLIVINMLSGMYYSYKKENEKAESYFKNAILFGNKFKIKSDLSFSHQEYSKFLLKNKRYEEAYINSELFHEITNKIYNSNKIKNAKKVGINLELDEYKREIDKIEIENSLQAQIIKKSKIIVLLLVIAFVVLLLLLYSTYKNYNFKKKANNQLIIANEELLIAKEKAEEASKLKTQFVSTISHELRTPLYGVIGITNMLLDEHKELANSPHLNSLKFSARYLLSLVNDVLQINKIEESRIVFERLAFNIPDELNLIKNSLSFIAKNNKNNLILNIDKKIPEYLIGDKLRLSQIIINLTSNALKFTKNGEVSIIANLSKIEGKLHYVAFQIKDNGVGIAEEDQAKIFDKFIQIGRNEEDYQGTGLGLTIVKQLLELFGSKIEIDSKIGVGTTFSFTIAFDFDPDKTIEIINNIVVDLSPNQSFKILIVEDNKINQLVTLKILKKANYLCTIVDDGFQALNILEKESFDAILMDINMPIMNGFETTRKIRWSGINTPIIALTAFSKTEITEEAISAGMNDIIIKPFEPQKLFQIINSQISKFNKTV